MKKLLFCILIITLVGCSGSDDNTGSSSGNCINPAGINVSNVSGSSAIVNYTLNTSIESYRIEFGPTGFIQGSGTLINTTNSENYTINGLSGSTNYDVYVRGICSGTGNFSDWIGPFTFTTSCNGGAFSGNVVLTTQQEVNDFGANCYITVNGDFSINEDPMTSDNITDLSPLSGLTTVNGNVLIFDNSQLTSLSGLNGLSYAFHLYIKGNTVLTNVSGVSNLSTIANGGIVIAENLALTSIQGLENITAVTTILTVRNNNVLTSLNGLDNIANVANDVNINTNPMLDNLCALTTLYTTGTVGGNTTILGNTYNPSTSDIAAGNCSL